MSPDRSSVRAISWPWCRTRDSRLNNGVHLREPVKGDLVFEKKPSFHLVALASEELEKYIAVSVLVQRLFSIEN